VRDNAVVWCAFNMEQLRILRPSPLELAGWLVVPRKRIGFIWGGETIVTKKTKRIYGERCDSPAQATVFWMNIPPAHRPPVESIILRTGLE